MRHNGKIKASTAPLPANYTPPTGRTGITSFEELQERLAARRAKWHPIHRWLVNHPYKGIAGKNSWFYVSRPHEGIPHLVRYYYKRAHWFIQRGLRGYSDYDVWSLDGYLCKWMPDALAALQQGHTHPTSITMEEWKEALEEMRQGFIAHEQMNNWTSLQDGEYELLEKRFKAGMAQLTLWFGSLWD